MTEMEQLELDVEEKRKRMDQSDFTRARTSIIVRVNAGRPAAFRSFNHNTWLELWDKLYHVRRDGGGTTPT